MNTFVHIHSSGRFDSNPAAFTNSLTKYLGICSIFTTTEVHKESREAMMRLAGYHANFGVVTGDHGARDDCGIMFDKNEWEKVAGFTAQILAGGAYRRADGVSVQGAYAAFAVLQHRVTSHRILVGVAHLPPTVEGKRGFGGRSIARARAWRTAQKNYRKLWNRFAIRYSADSLLIVADWNLNIKRLVIRQFLRALQPGMRPVWGNGPFPAGGTHGNRIIDHSWIRGKLRRRGNPQLMQDDNYADHRPYVETLFLAA